jgi:hypothetical protein
MKNFGKSKCWIEEPFNLMLEDACCYNTSKRMLFLTGALLYRKISRIIIIYSEFLFKTLKNSLHVIIP